MDKKRLVSSGLVDRNSKYWCRENRQAMELVGITSILCIYICRATLKKLIYTPCLHQEFLRYKPLFQVALGWCRENVQAMELVRISEYMCVWTWSPSFGVRNQPEKFVKTFLNGYAKSFVIFPPSSLSNWKLASKSHLGSKVILVNLCACTLFYPCFGARNLELPPTTLLIILLTSG